MESPESCDKLPTHPVLTHPGTHMPGFVEEVYPHQDQSQRAPWGEKQLSLSGLWPELQRLQEAISKDFLQW